MKKVLITSPIYGNANANGGKNFKGNNYVYFFNY